MSNPVNRDTETLVDSVIEQYREYVNPGLASLMSFGGFDDVEETAEGCLLRTVKGAEYLDFLGGYGVFSLGHRHPKVVEAVKRQLDRMPLSSRTFFSEPMANLAAKLAQITPGDLQYSFFCNSGAEAVEGALKMARIVTGRSRIISTLGGYHGKTMGSLSATGREKYREPFEPLIPGVTFVPFNDAEAVAQTLGDDVAAVIVEPVQGEGGINCPSDDYLPSLRSLCDAHDALLILDEVQTGLARTGAMFACQHWGVSPDIMTLAKALGGGVMPIGAVVGTPDIWQKTFGTNPLIHTSTFGGNPLACAAGLAALEAIEEEGLVEKARVRGEQLLSGLKQVQSRYPETLLEVRGMGLMIGVEFAVKEAAELTINGMSQRGVIAAYTLNNPNVIRLEPPLVVTEAQIERAITVFQEAVEMSVSLLASLLG